MVQDPHSAPGLRVSAGSVAGVTVLGRGYESGQGVGTEVNQGTITLSRAVRQTAVGSDGPRTAAAGTCTYKECALRHSGGYVGIRERAERQYALSHRESQLETPVVVARGPLTSDTARVDRETSCLFAGTNVTPISNDVGVLYGWSE